MKTLAIKGELWNSVVVEVKTNGGLHGWGKVTAQSYMKRNCQALTKAFAMFTFIGLLLLVKASAQTPEKKKIEEELLARARVNIEKYRKADAVVTISDSQGRPVKNLKVEINQQDQDFLFGNLSEEIFSPRLTAAEVRKFHDRFTALFNFTELTVKWGVYEKEQGKTEWQQFQKKLDWCKQNGVTPKGHTIGWTNMAGTPKWLLKLPNATATELYKTRIWNLVGGFKNQVKMWDVVNEPLTTVTWEKALEDSAYGPNLIDEGTRYNIKGITPEQVVPWVEKSFKWAGESDSSGDFIINEFNIVSKPETREKYYQLIKELLRRNAPVRGIGIQAHEPREMWYSPLEIVASFEKYRDLGLPLHITEFIPQSSGKSITGNWREGTWTEEAQAEFAEQFYILAFGCPSMVSIHWWGLSDKMIWLKNGGLLDNNFEPKPVYHRLMKLIKQDWMTRNISKVTDRKGQVSFRGFFGNYELVVTRPDGSKKTIKAHLGNTSNKWEIAL